MGTFLHLYETEEELNEIYNGTGYTEPWVSYTKEITKVHYNKHIVPPDYLTFKITSDGTIRWFASNNMVRRAIQYRLNDGEWTFITASTGNSAPTINVVEGDEIQFKGNNQAYATNASRYNSFSGSTAGFEISGSIMSLIYGDDFATADTLTSPYAFISLFRACTGLTSVEKLILPATTLAQNCYSFMFNNCTSLTSAEKLILPATTLAQSCYSGMFLGCTSLTTLPKLPATELAQSCYDSMFCNCSSLTTVPSNYLPVTTLVRGCYAAMFQGCSSLTAAPELPATELAQSCYFQMFLGCSSLTTAPELPATELANQCYGSMFMRCTSLTTAPELPVTTLSEACYSEMFWGCTNLNYIKCLAEDITPSNCTNNWAYGVSSTGTFVKSPNMSSWTTGEDGIPEGWTVVDNS